MSERDLTAAVKDALEEGTIRPAIFVELLFDSGPVRVWSGIGPMRLDTQTGAAFQSGAFQDDAFQTGGETVQGDVFLGVGTFGSIDKVEESAGDVRATGIAMTLSGIPSTMIALCLTEFFVNRPATIWLALFDEAGALIPNAIQIFKGRMDFPVIDEGGETATITVTAESILIDLERPRVARYTAEDQHSKYEDDEGLDYVASIQNVDVVWKSAG